MSTSIDYRNRPKPVKYGFLIECALIGLVVLCILLEGSK